MRLTQTGEKRPISRAVTRRGAWRGRPLRSLSGVFHGDGISPVGAPHKRRGLSTLRGARGALRSGSAAGNRHPPPPRKPALGKTLGPGALHPLPHASRGAFRMRDSGLSMAGVRDLARAGMPDRHSAIIEARKPAPARPTDLAPRHARASPPAPRGWDRRGDVRVGSASRFGCHGWRRTGGRRSIIGGPGPLSGWRCQR